MSSTACNESGITESAAESVDVSTAATSASLLVERVVLEVDGIVCVVAVEVKDDTVGTEAGCSWEGTMLSNSATDLKSDEEDPDEEEEEEEDEKADNGSEPVFSKRVLAAEAASETTAAAEGVVVVEAPAGSTQSTAAVHNGTVTGRKSQAADALGGGVSCF